MLTRRGALLTGLGGLAAVAAGGGAYGLVEADVLPGRIRLDRALGRCGAPPEPPRETAAVRQARFRSRARRAEVGWSLVHPKDRTPHGLPVVVVLHGLGGDHARAVTDLALPAYLGQAAAQGVPPFALVTVDGGGTYWHRRASGDDPLGMITGELLPRLRRLGLRTGRIGLYGYSMGGYGALLAAERLGKARVAAVAAASPAVFTSYDAARGANPDAFDGAADFARNDVLRGLGAVRPIPAWVGCGHSDVFADVTETIRGRLPNTVGGLSEGCHDTAYWRRELPGILRFLGSQLG